VKVVIFCGGMGIRMGEATRTVPKPMIPVGSRPIVWHIMSWYASWGHTDFILCLGYLGDRIRDYFGVGGGAFSLNGDGPSFAGGADPSSWRVTFVDTGLHSLIGDRLKAVESLVAGDEMFLATYGDGLTDAPLDGMISTLEESGKTGLFMSVCPRIDYHLVKSDDDGVVRSVTHFRTADVRINGGFFVFRHGIFDVLRPGEELVDEPFARLIAKNELLGYRYDGFWEPMDTLKDKQKLEALAASGAPPWSARPGGHVQELRRAATG
jgi:glucose-1-phosphate cytidylyltransferase